MYPQENPPLPPLPITTKLLLPNYAPVHSKERNLALRKNHLINNLIYPAACYMKPDNSPVLTLPYIVLLAGKLAHVITTATVVK